MCGVFFGGSSQKCFGWSCLTLRRGCGTQGFLRWHRGKGTQWAGPRQMPRAPRCACRLFQCQGKAGIFSQQLWKRRLVWGISVSAQIRRMETHKCTWQEARGFADTPGILSHDTGWKPFPSHSQVMACISLPGTKQITAWALNPLPSPEERLERLKLAPSFADEQCDNHTEPSEKPCQCHTLSRGLSVQASPPHPSSLGFSLPNLHHRSLTSPPV